MLAFLDTLIETRPTWQLGLGFFALMSLACEIGFTWHRRGLKHTTSKAESGEESHVLAAALGLLALMLAFTFSMAQGRHDDRRDLLVKEADALVTTYLQTQLVDQPGRDALNHELRRYADLRIKYFEVGGDRARIEALDGESEAMHAVMWETMLRATKPHRTTTVVGLVSQPLAQLIGLQAERKSARIARVPTEVMQALLIYSVITALLMGYILGGHRARHRSASFILFALTAVAVMVTLDLDSPTTGGIRLDPQPLLAARQVLDTPFDVAIPAE